MNREPIGEEIIYQRMRRLDRDQGCHAALERIAMPGSWEPNSPRYSISQVRRRISALRQKGQLVYAGATINVGPS